MSNQLKVYIDNLGRYVDFNGGETLLDICRRVGDELGFTPICAHVNNKTEGLRFPLFAPKKVNFLDVTSSSGQRVYVRSLCMTLYHAVIELCPSSRLSVEHSVSRGHYCRISGVKVTPTLVERLKAHMQSLIDRDIPFMPKERLTSDVKRLFSDEGLDDKVLLLDTVHQLYTTYYTMDGLNDSYYGALAPSTGLLKAFDLQPYHDGLLLLAFDPADPSRPMSSVTQAKMFKAFTDHLAFNNVIGVKNVGELNRAVEHGNSADLINVAEALHDKKISSIADDIAARHAKGGARIVLIAGPSSSGKTTTTKRLATYLMTDLLKPIMISLDDYFVDRHLTPRDETGDYDYESLYALDLELFNSHLNALIRGEEVEIPRYNFETGTRSFNGNRLRMDDNTVLLIEGIHGLNPELTSHVPEKMKYRVYVSALTTLSIDDHNWVPTTDNRLLRRIIRDHKYRGTSAIETLRRWPSVRRGEERWIFPYQENADAMFNSSLLFELGVMKEYGEEILSRVPHDVPEYAEAYRLLKFLSYFSPISDNAIPPTSLLREFLGGSSFKY
ncbi:MAG: nucleoside kinase [Muribaculaceae bacterium]|nr:nucleoside kinase [Muribaculaceae bacterium]